MGERLRGRRLLPGADDLKRSKALAEGWNGNAWQLQQAVAPPGATYNELGGVSCVSATFCEAVGGHNDSAGDQDVLAETWDGQKWTIQSVPGLPIPSGSSFSVTGSTRYRASPRSSAKRSGEAQRVPSR